MDFGSKFVYAYDDSEEECVSDEEFEGGMDRDSDFSASSSDEDEAKICPTPVVTLGKPGAQNRRSKGWMGSLSGMFSKRSDAAERTAPGSGPLARAAGGSSAPKAKKKKKHHWRARSPSPTSTHSYLAQRSARSQPITGRKWRRADTNIITVKFNQLKTPINMHTGDPCHCTGCSAVLSKISKLQPVIGSDERVWNCEFCGHTNPLDLVDEEIPQAEDVTFMLEPAISTKASGPAGSDQSLVIFCVDISGSMCVTTEVPGRMNLRGSHLERLQSLNDTRESQYLPRQRRDITFVSRLQAVQAAVDHQLEEITKDFPNRRVCLITFSTEVAIIGDGSSDVLTIAGEKLSNKEELIQTAGEIPLPSSVKDKREKLGQKLFDLEEGGMTALGPALLLSISMASQVPGSKVIICTDGLANVGLGNLDELHTDDVYAQSASFYSEISDMAVNGGVCVSVLSIAGTKCRLVELGKVAEATGGQVNIVDPLKLTQEFGSILADPIIATGVSATLQIHSGLYLRHEETKHSTVTKYIGNVTKSSEITFEYGVRKTTKKSKSKSADKGDGVVYDNVTSKSGDAKSKPGFEDAKVVQENVANEAMETGHSRDNTNLPGTIMDTKTENAVTTACVEIDRTVEPMETTDNTEVLIRPTETTEEATRSTENTQHSTRHTENTENRTEKPVQPMEDESGSQTPGSSSSKIEQDLKELPFQLQIRYTDLEGAKALRVITQCKPVTKERAEAEKSMNMAALGVHAAKHSAHLALDGDYTQSRLNAFMYQRLLHRGRHVVKDREEAHDVYDNFYSNVGGMEHRMLQQQRTERSTFGRTYSDEEEECDDDGRSLSMAACVPTASSYKSSSTRSSGIGKKGVRRRMATEDKEAERMYSNCAINSSIMKKKVSKKSPPSPPSSD